MTNYLRHKLILIIDKINNQTLNILSKIANKDQLTLGMVFPLEAYPGSVPQMQNQEALAQRAEEAGFKALWFRDVPFHDPSFGDAGQMYDPWIYMTHIMNHTKQIALATGSIILPLRHPVHTAKSIQSLQNLSDGRIIIGVASGDRPIEYPAFNKELSAKSELFRDSFEYINILQQDFPTHQSKAYGMMNGSIDLLPKSQYKTPYLVTGHSGQSIDWIAQHADGWLYYPRNMEILKHTMSNWMTAVGQAGFDWKPYMQSLYVDLVNDQSVRPSGIHLGFRCNPDYLRSYLQTIKQVGVNHVIINPKFSSLPIKQVIDIFGEHIIPNLDS